MFRALPDVWDVALLSFQFQFVLSCGLFFCTESSAVCSELTGASEMGLFADVPTDLPPLSKNKVFTFQVNVLKV